MKFIIERSRYLAIIGVISLLLASFAAFAWGTIKTVTTTLLVIQTLGKDPAVTIELIEILDSFLIATAILMFAASLYELFIGKLDMPEWMLAHDLYELKAKLSSMIVLVMAVKFLQKLIEVKDAAAVANAIMLNDSLFKGRQLKVNIDSLFLIMKKMKRKT